MENLIKVDDLGVPSVGISEDLPRGLWQRLCSGGTTRCWSSLRMLACFTYGQKSKGQIHLPMVVLSMFYLLLYLCFTYDLLYIDLPIFSGDEYPLIPAFWGFTRLSGLRPLNQVMDLSHKKANAGRTLFFHHAMKGCHNGQQIR